MFTSDLISRSWMGSQNTPEQADWWMVGLPFDGTTTNRPGTRFGPASAREASWGLEDYSPAQDKELSTVRFYDWGELDLPCGNRDKSLSVIETTARDTLAAGKKWLGIGGEHLVTYPAFIPHFEKYPDIGVLHFDAHADLRQDYLGEPLSHATVIRRLADLVGPDRLVQMGIRSGPKEEFDWMKQHQTLLQGQSPNAQWAQLKAKLMGRPVFLTIDLDVLDPSVLPGTGTPEPGGILFHQLIEALLFFKDLHFVGADVVELSPHYDPTGCSSAVAAKVIREVLLLIQ